MNRNTKSTLVDYEYPCIELIELPAEQGFSMTIQTGSQDDDWATDTGVEEQL